MLDHEFTTIKDWGYDYFKLDGEFAIPKYVPHVDLSRLYNASIDPVAAYRNRMKVIRNAIGQDSFIEECVAGTPLNATGYADSFFNGDDLYDNWQGMYSLFSSINANTFFNHIVGYNMPGEGMALEPHMSFEECAKKRNPIVLETMTIARTSANWLRHKPCGSPYRCQLCRTYRRGLFRGQHHARAAGAAD